MDDVLEMLRDAYEENDYDVADVTRNRSQVRVVLREAGAKAEELRAIANNVVEEDDVLGLEVTTESAGGQDQLTTVVTFRYRPS